MQTNMADEGLIGETGNQHLNSNTVVVTAPGIAVEETVNDDILQGTFVGGEEFDQEQVEYAVQRETEDVAHSVAQQVNAVSDSGLDGSALDSTTQIVAQSNGFGTETYRVVNTLPDGTISIQDDLIAQAIVPEEGTGHVDETESGVTLVDHNGHNVIDHQVLEEQQALENQTVFEGQNQILEGRNEILEGQNQVLEHQEVLLSHQQQDQGSMQAVDSDQNGNGEKVTVQQPQQHTVQVTLVNSGNQSGAPLGSSQNPIRIIQQGNNYTPIQQLTQEQLQQIMQVVQQQQVARNTQESGGSVLFNPSTNTRIVYRVIYPSELHKGQQAVLHVTPKGTTTTTTTTVPVAEAIQIPKKPYRRRGKDEEEDKVDGPEMSKEEKEERKKHRPRTRSGRVSKPPKHMVKDYKHIHVLDWNEDYDDSDGGYSDYKGSDEEKNMEKEHDKDSNPDLYSGLAMSSSRPKNHKCQTCEKSYIGQAGLARHYRLNPSHGSLPAGEGEDGELAGNGVSSTTENSPVLMNNGSITITTVSNSVGGLGASTATSNMGSNAGNLSEDSNTQDSIPSSSGAISPITTRTPRRGRGVFRGRGRWAYHHHTAPARKKQKLKELVKTMENEDLMEVVLPRLVQFVSLWELMLMKVETCNGSHPRADHIYQEFLALHRHVKRVCREGLQAVKPDTGQQNGIDTEDIQERTASVLKLEDEAIAKSLGLTSGSYEVKDLPVNEYTSFRYKYLTSDPNGPPGVSAQKRTIQVVSPDELVSQSPHKRIKTTSLLHSSGAAPPPVTLAPSATAASSLLTSIVSNSGLTGAGHRQQTLFRTVAVQQPQSSLLQTVRVQQPQSSLLQNMTVQQPPSVVTPVTLPSQQPSAAVLRTVGVPSQPQTHTLLRTVAMPPQPQLAQTSLLRVQQPVVVPASRQSNGSGVMGVSLLNNSRSAVLSQQPSIAVLKSPPGPSSHILVAAPASPSVTGPNVGEIPQSQAAQVVSVLPSSLHTTSLSLLPQTSGAMGTDFNPMAPDDFMDNSDDSLVSSVSGLSSANSSGLVSAHSSLPNGDMSEVGFSSVVKVNGVSSKSDSLSLDNKEQLSLGNDSPYVSSMCSLQEDPEQLPVTSAVDSASTTTSLLIKCENGDLYTIASAGESVPGTLAGADSVLASTGVIPSSTPSVNGLLNGSQLEDSPVKVEKDSLAEDHSGLLTDESEVMNQEDPLQDAALELDGSAETSSFTLHQNATLYQTEDGTIIIQNPDGTSFQLQGIGEQGLSLESVQDLLSQMVSGEQVQTDVQQ